jgi:cytochrome d ubiquinol oxidase subunit I
MFDDPILLARAQFGLNIGFHILFPTVTIALAWVLVYLRVRDASSGAAWVAVAYRLWVKIFALSFGLGVVSGLTMSFQFGTNWPGFMEKAGNVAGPLLGYEVMTAFFLEASFIGVMLFGRDRVPEWLHTVSALLVAIGTSLSAFWILALNSWMQTPQGFSIIDGRFHAADWWAIVFNPSFPFRLAHMWLASALTVAFLIAGLSAFQLLRNRAHEPARHMLRHGLIMGALLAPLQAQVGDMHGLNTLEHQPAKIAAIEAIWHTERGSPLVLFAWPDAAEKRNKYSIEVPHLASLILTHEFNGELNGLNEFAGKHPPVAPVFFAFRTMVGVGVLMIVTAWWSCLRLWRRGELQRWLLRWLACMTFAGWIATLCGWMVSEIGRQPWLVYGLLATADAASAVPAAQIGFTLIAYALVYAGLLVSYMVVLTQLAIKEAGGADEASTTTSEGPPPGPSARPAAA